MNSGIIKTNKLYKRLTYVMIFMLTLSFCNISVLAEEVSNLMEVRYKNLEEKLDIKLMDAFEEEEYVSILVEMKDKVDVYKVAQNAEMEMKTSSLGDIEEARKFAVVNELKYAAQSTQEGLIKLLEKEKEKGNVKEYRSFYIVNMINVKCTKEVAEEIAKHGEVEAIHLDDRVEMDNVEVVDLSKVPELNAVAEEDIAWSVKQVRANEVWDTFGITGTGAVVGIIDTGFDYRHEAIASKWRGYNPENPSQIQVEGNWIDTVDGKTTPYDIAEKPHGTHVIGSIVGQCEDGKNAIGVAPGAQYIVAKAFDAEGGMDSWLLAAGEWMIAPNGDPSLSPDVVNNSWGGQPGLDEWYRDMVNAWRATGIFPVFSGGNEPMGSAPEGSVSAPSNYPESFSVAATDINNIRGDFSRRGPSPYPGDIKPDISAPGVAVLSAVPGGYEAWNGTSMAAPHVAGVVALLKSLNNSLTPTEIEDIIMDTATPLTDEMYPNSPNFGYGYGLVNAYDAVSAIANGIGEIVGTVTTTGNDESEAIVEEVNTYKKAYIGIDKPITIKVRDDVAVMGAEAYVTNNLTKETILVPMEKLNDSYKESEYKVIVPGSFIKEGGITVEFRIKDYGNNLTISEPLVLPTVLGERAGEFKDNFTKYPSNWTLINGDWQWGEIQQGPNYEFRNKVMATNLDGEYNRGESLLISPPIDLSNTEYAYLTFKEWHAISNKEEKFQLLISRDNMETWDIIKDYEGTSENWEKEFVILNEYINSSNPIFIAFKVKSTYVIRDLGWYIDNFEINLRDTEAPARPTELAYEVKSSGLELKWNESLESDVKEYAIYKKINDGEFTLLGKTTQRTFLDRQVQSGNVYEYYIKCIDIFENESEPSDILRVSDIPIVMVYYSDFEENDGGLISNNTQTGWQWGVPTVGPSAYSGEKLWATNLSGNYTDYANDWIEIPEVDLRELREATLSFKEWISVEDRSDDVFVEIFYNNTWIELRNVYLSNENWNTVNIDLTNYCGNIVKIRFRLDSDIMFTKPGWYIDDVSIFGMSRASANVEAMEDSERAQDIDKEATSEINIAQSGKLPVEATVKVVETNKSARTNGITGEYSLRVAANMENQNWTIEASSYGYYPKKEIIKLNRDELLQLNFNLEKIPTNSVSGLLINARTGEPVNGAYIRVVGDPRIKPVCSNENGEFTLQNVLQGQWQLEIRHKDFDPSRTAITSNEENTDLVEIKLDPFIGFDDVISYVDDTEENGIVLRKPTDGFAVRMIPEAVGKLTGMMVKLYGPDWPTPGGNRLKVGIVNSKPNGEPGELVYLSDTIEMVRGSWNFVDLSEAEYMIDGEFYLRTFQVDPKAFAPGIAIDGSSPNNNRNYMYADGEYTLISPNDIAGNLMIRAMVEYGLQNPVVTSHENNQYINAETIELKGTVVGECDVKIYNNDEVVDEIRTENKQFSSIVSLSEGENRILTKSILNGEETRGAVTNIIRDTINPAIHTELPEEYNTNNKLLSVKGMVEEINMDKLKVNGEDVEIDASNQFTKELILKNGENIITIEAIDLAGNISTKELTVNVKTNPSAISNIMPNEDVVVKNGETLVVSFESEIKGGKASFVIELPMLMNAKANSITMNEIREGYYEGTWTVPEGVSLNNCNIIVRIEDVYGNITEEVAKGRISTERTEEGYLAEILGIEYSENFGQSLLEVEFKNISDRTINPTAIIVVQDSQNRVVNISFASISKLGVGERIKLGGAFEKLTQGEYKVKAYIWNNIRDMEPLSSSMEKNIVIE